MFDNIDRLELELMNKINILNELIQKIEFLAGDKYSRELLETYSHYKLQCLYDILQAGIPYENHDKLLKLSEKIDYSIFIQLLILVNNGLF